MNRTSLDECYDLCERLTKQTAGNFRYSFSGLPADKYRAMCVLYAFMRVTDDFADNATRSLTDRLADVEAWRAFVGEALRTEPSILKTAPWPDPPRAVLPAMRDVADRFAIPHQHLFAVLDGVQSDLQFENADVASDQSRFASFEQLADYCYLVAGAVGLCCIHIWGFHGDAAKRHAIDCGTAFQLTNILRDVGPDAQAGRVYLPAEDLQRFGVSIADLVAQRCDDRFRALMSFEAQRAKSFYASAERLLPFLEPHGRPILKAMLQLYGGLLHEIERRHFDVFSRHVALPRWRKLWIAADALLHQRLISVTS